MAVTRYQDSDQNMCFAAPGMPRSRSARGSQAAREALAALHSASSVEPEGAVRLAGNVRESSWPSKLCALKRNRGAEQDASSPLVPVAYCPAARVPGWGSAWC